MKHLPEKYKTLCESLGWAVSEYPEENVVDLEMDSLTEDGFVLFTIPVDNFAEEIEAVYFGFLPTDCDGGDRIDAALRTLAAAVSKIA